MKSLFPLSASRYGGSHVCYFMTLFLCHYGSLSRSSNGEYHYAEIKISLGKSMMRFCVDIVFGCSYMHLSCEGTLNISLLLRGSIEDSSCEKHLYTYVLRQVWK